MGHIIRKHQPDSVKEESGELQDVDSLKGLQEKVMRLLLKVEANRFTLPMKLSDWHQMYSMV